VAHLLIADNSPFYRKLLSDGLAEKGYTSTTVADGLEALQALEGERFDAAILDLVMPRLSGARACRQIKAGKNTGGLPVIILSGLREDEIDDAAEIGADAFVAKMQADAMMTHLATTLDEMFAGRLEDTHRGFDRMHRREVVSELLEERRSRDAILSSLQEGYLRIAGDGKVQEANPAAMRMLRCEEHDLVNRHLAAVLSLPEELVAPLLDNPGGQQECRVNIGESVIAVRTSDGNVAGQEQGTFLLLTDVTGEAIAAAEKRSLEKQVEASERFSALGEIVAGVAHELNNPLTGLLGYAELLLKLAPDERSRVRLGKLHHEAVRCRRIVENLLCFARQRQAYPRMQGLNDVIIKAVRMQAVSAAKAGVKVHTSLSPDIPMSMFDFGQMEQVVGNLLTNAFQALAGLPEERRQVHVRTAMRDGQLRLEVEDLGSGVPENVRERVFEPFFTTRRPEGGTGLGLAVTYGIVSEHGGRIFVEDAAPGARLVVELPAIRASVSDAAEPDETPSAGTAAPAILLVDDEPVVLDLLEDVLTDSGFRVARAGNGAQALEHLEEDSFAAILIDLKMPDMDGRRLYQTICERRPDLASRVVFTTGDLDRPDLKSFLDEAGAVLLRKPFELEKVASTFHAIADGHPPA
jgi:signal transduction histidine kinase/DNA-binding response OmpR family regulator